MPEAYAHVRTAKRAAQAVRYKIKCPQAFAAGANGPDAFFCFEGWKPADKRLYDLPKLGHRMHHEKTGSFLCSLVAHAGTAPQVEYTLGFLSHYATDTVVHPYVVAVCQPGMPYEEEGGHQYFEAALDTLLHEQDTGDGMVPPEDSAPMLAGDALADIANLLKTCIQEVYGPEIPVEYLADSFYYNTKLRGLFATRSRGRKAFYSFAESTFAKRGYITGHVTPTPIKPDLPNTWTDPFTGEEKSGDVFALLEQAQHRSEKYMAAAILTWAGQQSRADLAEQLGSLCYLEGRATKLSDPDLGEASSAPENQEQQKPEEPASAQPDSIRQEPEEPTCAQPEPQDEVEPAAEKIETQEREEPIYVDLEPDEREPEVPTPAQPEEQTKPVSTEPENIAVPVPAEPQPDTDEVPDLEKPVTHGKEAPAPAEPAPIKVEAPVTDASVLPAATPQAPKPLAESVARRPGQTVGSSPAPLQPDAKVVKTRQTPSGGKRSTPDKARKSTPARQKPSAARQKGGKQKSTKKYTIWIH